MKEHTPVGMNRTGLQMSPFDASEMQAGLPPSLIPDTSGDESALAEMRASYIEEADPIGSVPVPATVTGAVTTGVSMMTGHQPELFLDKLGERLAFERTGTRLYDALIAKFEAMDDGATSMTLDDLQRIREDEAQHFAVVATAIEILGGDPTSQTPCADLAGVESLGLMQVVTDPRTTLAQSLHALLVAEMTDQAGWELLIGLAEDQGQAQMVTDFTMALDEERDHLVQVQTWFEEATLGAPLAVRARDSDADESGSLLH